jgi:glutamate-1-semialdehyde 2,1-aminomutase
MISNSHDQAWRDRAQAVLPGGMYGHLSTRLLPESYPQFFARGSGTRIWDVDGNGYIDYMCAFGPNLFGYGDAEIDQAYIDQLRVGDTLTGPSPLIVELAEAFTAQIPHAEWVMFCKNGTDATTAAVMAARQATGRKVILRAHGAYHGTAPWATPSPHGTTPGDRAQQVFYTYNDVASLAAAVAEAGDDLAAIISTPVGHPGFAPQEMPTAEYAQAARALCDAAGAMLITDEVRTGFRVSRQGIWDDLGASPDLSAWGKVLANGHCLSALVGNARARGGVEDIFVTGSYWFSAAAMAASLVVMRRIRETDYLERLTGLGQALRDGLGHLAVRHGVELHQTGPVTMPLLLFEGDTDLRAGFFFATEMLNHGIYMHPWHNMFLNTAMSDQTVEQTLIAADQALARLAQVRADLPPNARLMQYAAAVE